MKITTYEEACEYLKSFISKSLFLTDLSKQGHPLDRTRLLLKLLDNPQDKLKSVLIGGTAGKGSTAYLIAHILQAAGYKTGFTMSPHLQKVNERFQINSASISDNDFLSLMNRVVSVVEHMSTTELGDPSYFEILIGMIFLYFVEQKVDIAVVEVGMGGEFDATNVLYPFVCVLTNVSLDHVEFLGNTVTKIAKTKAGIIKSNQQLAISRQLKVVTGVKQPSVIKIVENRCKKTGTQLSRLQKDFMYSIKNININGEVFDFTSKQLKSTYTNLELSLIGDFQVENASLAIEAVLHLRECGFTISEHSIRQALKTASFQGRFEVLRFSCHPEFISGSRFPRTEMLKLVQHDKEKTLILDGAHNPVKMRAFIHSLKKLNKANSTSLKLRGARKIFVVAFKKDKDIVKMLKEIVPVADTIIATEFNVIADMMIKSGATDARAIAQEVQRLGFSKELFIEPNSKKALKKAHKILISQYRTTQSIIIITGSLYLVGETREYVKPSYS